MTYCVALCLEDGLVFASDSRTNAGVDYVTTYSKTHIFTPSPDRLFVLLSAGNLATTQEVINHINRDLDNVDGTTNLGNVNYLFEAAEYVGHVSQQVQQEHNAALSSAGVSGETTLLLGGQIAGQEPGLMLIYPQGNYIAASKETPYLQIGESKYGKPSIDRIVDHNLSLYQGAQLCLVSLVSTSRSNITVGPPFEITTYIKDQLAVASHCVFDEKHPYLEAVQETWSEGIRQAFLNLPPVPWQTAVPQSTAPQQQPSQEPLQQSQQQQQQTLAQPYQGNMTSSWPPQDDN